MICKYCNDVERDLGDDVIIRGGKPLTFEAEKTCGSFTKLTYINIQNGALSFRHFKCGGSDLSRIDLPKVKINYCPMCGRKL